MTIDENQSGGGGNGFNENDYDDDVLISFSWPLMYRLFYFIFLLYSNFEYFYVLSIFFKTFQLNYSKK